MKAQSNNSWLGDDSEQGDVVMSSRVRLARNIAGFPFVKRASDTQKREILHLIRKATIERQNSEKLLWVDMTESSRRDRQLLVERHLISRQFSESDIPRAVLISSQETVSVMVNEEDHLRIASLLPGLALQEAVQGINKFDDLIESGIDYAFDSRWGYLTACPTNVGCGIRFSVMLHLPALRVTGEIDRVRRAAKDLNLAVRGFYGEGSESAGDLYQVSNQVTLGISEQDLLSQFQQRIVPRIIEYERQARQVLLDRNQQLLKDRVHRALAILQNAWLLGMDESMKLLSRVRLGIYTGSLKDVDVRKVNQLFLQAQPGHLQAAKGCRLNNEQLRSARAEMIRESLQG